MTHFVVIHALLVSWYPKRRSNNPTSDVMMDLDPWRSLGVGEVIEEASCMVKKSLHPHLMVLNLDGVALINAITRGYVVIYE